MRLFLFLLLGRMMNLNSFFIRKNYFLMILANRNDQKQSKKHILLLVGDEVLKKYWNFLVFCMYQIIQAFTFNSFHKQRNVNHRAFSSRLFYRINCHHSLHQVHRCFQNYLFHLLFHNVYIFSFVLMRQVLKNSISQKI